jgi:hypothetical protein
VLERFRRRSEGRPGDTGPGNAVQAAERGLRDAEKAHARLVKDRRAALDDAERDHRRSVAAARSELERSEVEHRRRVEDAEKRLLSVRATLAPLEVARFGKLVLHEDRIATRSGTAPLGRSLAAVADTAARIAIARPSAVARLAATGAVDGRAFRSVRGSDARKLYVLVDSPDLVALEPCRQGEEEAAARFAARVNIAALNADRLAGQRAAAVEQAEHELELARALRAPVDAAAHELERIAADTSAIDAARAALEEAEAATAELEEHRARVEEARQELAAAMAAAAQAASEAARADVLGGTEASDQPSAPAEPAAVPTGGPDAVSGEAEPAAGADRA